MIFEHIVASFMKNRKIPMVWELQQKQSSHRIRVVYDDNDVYEFSVDMLACSGGGVDFTKDIEQLRKTAQKIKGMAGRLSEYEFQKKAKNFRDDHR